MSHIDFDEIVAHALCDRIDSEYLELAARINRHVMTCPECFKMYKAIDSFFDSVEKISLTQNKDKRMTLALESIYSEKDDEQLREFLISDFRRKIKANRAFVDIKISDELDVSFEDDRYFGNVYLKNGILTFELKSGIARSGDSMYLFSNDRAYFGAAVESDDGKLLITYIGAEPGDYSVLL